MPVRVRPEAHNPLTTNPMTEEELLILLTDVDLMLDSKWEKDDYQQSAIHQRIAMAIEKLKH